MNRQVLFGVVAVALAGCTQTWPAAPPGARTSYRLPPVGLTPVPNIYEAITAENPRIDPTSVHPENGPVLANLGTASESAAGRGRSDGGGVLGGEAGPRPCEACQVRAAAAPAAVPAPAMASNGAAFGLPAPANRPAHLKGSSPGPAVATTAAAQGSAPAPPASEPARAADPSVPTPASLPAAAAVPAAGPAATLPPESASVAAPVSAASTLTPAPPEAEVERVSVAAPGPAPTSETTTTDPAATATTPSPKALPPAPAGSVSQTVMPLELPPLPPLPEAKDPPEAASAAPAPTASPPLPPAAVAPASSPAAPAPETGAAARSGTDAKVDPQVLTTAADPIAMHAEESPVKLTEAGHIAARVGDEVITLNELTAAVKERIAKLPGGYKPSPQEIKGLTSQILDILIERSIIIQEAKRELKKPEPLKLINDAADKAWREEELPPLLRQYSVENEHKLKAKLAEQGKSLDQMRETYRQEFLARGFLEQKLKHKITVTVPEMRDYYNAHLDDFNRPEQWTWREVLIEVDKHPNRAAARHKAEAILDRLRRGEDFAKLVQAESEGPNRASGGLWETAPDSYAVAAVNSAVKSLPIGHVSPIIEGPSSFHLVRVEARRAAGPATFAEVQDRIRKIVHHRKADKESSAFLDKLRQQTVVTTIFDHTDYAPSATRPTRDAEPTTASTY